MFRRKRAGFGHTCRDVPYGYTSVFRNRFLIVNCSRMAHEFGYNVYDYQAPSGFKNYCTCSGLFVPRAVVDAVKCKRSLQNQAKEERAAICREKQVVAKVQPDKDIASLFPGIPQEYREEVLDAVIRERGQATHKKSENLSATSTPTSMQDCNRKHPNNSNPVCLVASLTRNSSFANKMSSESRMKIKSSLSLMPSWTNGHPKPPHWLLTAQRGKQW